MPRGCLNPVWPCAMTGSVAALAGFSDLGVVLHGSSGCYYYTESVVRAPVHCTFIVEEEIIFGAEDRLRQVVAELARVYDHIAVVTMCVPAVTGEDIREFLHDYDVMIVDAPGFIGNLEEGYLRGLACVHPKIDPGNCGVNIDGLCSIDPFCTGNRMEAERILRNAGLLCAAVFCDTTLDTAWKAAPVTLQTNPDLGSGVGESAGSLLGLSRTAESIHYLGDRCSHADIEPVIGEIEAADERIIHACDKYLRQYDPPDVAIFSTAAYAEAAADMLTRYLDAQIAIIGLRNEGTLSRFSAEYTIDLERIGELIDNHRPDLLIGSSYEQVVAPNLPFVGITQPMRTTVMLHNRPLIGTEGALWFMETVLNECRRKRTG
jgi:nitrogenase molybdenum-iron protein alpha/beta subunit